MIDALSIVVSVTERASQLANTLRSYHSSISKLEIDFEFIIVLIPEYESLVDSLVKIQEELGNISIVLLNRNYGDAGVLRVGIDHVKYDHILMLPPYEQISPDAMPKIMHTLGENDAVVVNRWPRRDSRINRIQSYVFKSVLKMLAYDVPKDPGSGIRLAKKEIFDELKLYGDLHRFFFMLASQLGFRIAELDIPQSDSDTHRRIYSLRTYLSRLLDILTVGFLTRFNQKPLRFFGTGGALSSSVGLLGLSYIGIERIFFDVAVADRPLLVLFSLFLVLGIQLIAIGLVGETIIFTSATTSKEYRIRKIIN